MFRGTCAAVSAAFVCGLLGPGAGQAAGAGLSTPQLIERAERAGEIGPARATLYRVYALAGDERLPQRFRAPQRWDGTLVARDVVRALPALEPSATKAAIGSLLTSRGTGPAGTGTSTCLVSVAPMPNTLETEHFYIEYNALTLRGGLTIAEYAASLEGAWGTEVGRFGWAAPPVLTEAPAPGGKYHVRIDELSPQVYGFVSDFGSHAGRVGDNPATRWDDEDADASCMVLNADFHPFPGTAQNAMDATTAHELTHSIQYGIGALSGAHAADDVFVEGGATWMEDEVYDAADDNYNYLWPEFEDDMGDYDGSPYPYWITFRGLMERYGAGRPHGSEQVFQHFWELTSKGVSGNLAAMDSALRRRGTTLANAFHAYAIAVKFNKACGGSYRYPLCFEEGSRYVAAAGATEAHGAIAWVGGAFAGALPDNYSINWVQLPAGQAPYRVTLTGDGAGGVLRGTAVCDLGTRFRRAPLVRDAGQPATASATIDPRRCESVVAVLTNQARTADNPDSSADRSYVLATSAP